MELLIPGQGRAPCPSQTGQESGACGKPTWPGIRWASQGHCSWEVRQGTVTHAETEMIRSSKDCPCWGRELGFPSHLGKLIFLSLDTGRTCLKAQVRFRRSLQQKRRGGEEEREKEKRREREERSRGRELRRGAGVRLLPAGVPASGTMIHFCLVHSAWGVHCWLPRSHRVRL